MSLLIGALAPGCETSPEPPPERLESAEARTRGRELYVEHCALCHGVEADGRGLRRHALSGPAADFTTGAWRSDSSPGETFATIRDGVRGTSMPSWRMLGEGDTWDLVAYLWSVGEDAR